MPADRDDRRSAIEAADGTCPRCGAARAPDQRYCLDCGLELPGVTGTLPRLRRLWMRRVGWYPGDWVWISLLTLVVAAAGAASSIVLTESRRSQGPVFVATSPVTVVVPTAVPTVTSTAPGGTTTTAPTTTPRRKPAGPPNGRLTWPKNENGWTIVLVSYPKTNGHSSALTTASKAAKSGLGEVGILDSSVFASLQPGYFVVFTGIYSSKDDADAAVTTARQAGFGGAYSRQIAR
jgi:hypothetical protein